MTQIFDWNKEIDKYEHFLDHESLIPYKEYICGHINASIDRDECTFDPIFLENIKKLDFETRIQVLIETGTGPMCRCTYKCARAYFNINKDRESSITLNEWLESGLNKTVFKYATPQYCYVIVLYIYQLVKLMVNDNPTIVHGPNHAFVLHNNIIYDLIWYKYGIYIELIDELNDKDTVFYSIDEYLKLLIT